jgi:hypothetical protein
MSQAGAPSIELLEAAVAAQLETVSVANGYKTDIGRVFRMRLIEDQIPDGALPAFVVVPIPNGDDFTPADGCYKGKLTLAIGGMVSIGQADLYDPDRVKALNWLMEDAINALLVDPAFGFSPNVDSVLENGDREVDPDRGFGLFALRLHLTYSFARGSM